MDFIGCNSDQSGDATGDPKSPASTNRRVLAELGSENSEPMSEVSSARKDGMRVCLLMTPEPFKTLPLISIQPVANMKLTERQTRSLKPEDETFSLQARFLIPSPYKSLGALLCSETSLLLCMLELKLFQ